MDGLKLKEIVDRALSERVASLELTRDGHRCRIRDLTAKVTQMEKKLVVEASNHAVCINERNTLLEKVAELEAAKGELESRLADARSACYDCR